ncbi:MAG TPA: S-layer homology domain-containing protein, partial [Chloroflexia bacterium]
MFDARLHRGQSSRLLVLALLAVLLTGSLTPAAAHPAPTGPAPAMPGGPQEPIGPCTLSFTDLPSSSPFYSFVQTLVCRSIVGGYSDNTFRPGANVTRGQLAKFVSNAAGYQDAIPATQQTFRDVPPDNPFWMFIERVHAHNVVGGYADGSFQPGNNVTRGQIAKFVSNAAVLTDSIPATQQTFADVPAANPFWLYIERAAQAGVVGGYSDGTFRPTNNVTRGQTAKFIANGFFPASAQQLIAAAYQAGQIDYPTSLLYRAYALFGDTRLPASYQGVGSTGDAMLFREIAAGRATLPASVLAQLQPFLVRPDDPASILN